MLQKSFFNNNSKMIFLNKTLSGNYFHRQNGMDSVHNMLVVNTDAKSQSTKDPERCLQDVERGEK